MRLIDADELERVFIGKHYGVNAIKYFIKTQPTIDPVKHGHFKAWWHGIDNPMTYTCSVCGFHINADAFYCSHCGAMMDEEDK